MLSKTLNNQAERPEERCQRPRRTLLICAALTLAVLAAYWPLWHCGFVVFDDYDYVVDNNAIQHGLNGRLILWSFTTSHAGNWHPLTWVSHTLDFQWYGLNAAGHHATSLVWHAANSVLLFLLLKRMTRTFWPSAVTAALFALHPMHVESVAWVSERKDVLSTFFWMLTVWAYVCYAEESQTSPSLSGGVAGSGSKSKVFYGLSLLCFALGLMSKPMLVTLPVILLLLDYWPLQRWQRPMSRLWLEKAPFFVLATLVSVTTLVAQQQNRIPLDHVPLSERLANLPVAYACYAGKLFCPERLAFFYPYVHKWPAWEVAAAAALVVVMTLCTMWRARTQPFLVVGWLWFLAGLAPVIGLVQVGTQSMADRYTYVPGIGLFLMVVWLAREWLGKPGRVAAAVLATVALAGCFHLTSRQAGYWKDTGTLLAHTVETTADNYYACAVLGDYLARNGQKAAGIQYLDKAVKIAPSFEVAQNDLGHLLLDEGRADDALPHLQLAAALKPEAPEAHYNLGLALLAKGRLAEALDQFQTQVNLRPGDAIAQFNFGSVLFENNLLEDAIPHLEKAAAINPSDAGVHYKLGNAYFQKGQAAEAVGQYEQALRLRPDYVAACNNLAWILGSSPVAAVRDGARAVDLASRADRLVGGKDPVIAGTLAVACAEAGEFARAVEAASRARDLAKAQTNAALAGSLEERLELFRGGQPFRDTPRPPTNGP